jgi:CheY-like chemotaxis protein
MGKKRVLMVEDDRVICDLMKHVLEGNGYVFDSAYNGVEGLEKMGKFQPDVVILDVNMPRMDGMQLLTAIKTSPKTSEIPVIMCTDRNSFKDIDQADVLGADAYIPKPVVPERILNKLTELLK